MRLSHMQSPTHNHTVAEKQEITLPLGENFGGRRGWGEILKYLPKEAILLLLSSDQI